MIGPSVFVCMEELTAFRSSVLTVKPVNKPISKIDMVASCSLFRYLTESLKKLSRRDDLKESRAANRGEDSKIQQFCVDFFVLRP